MVHETTLDASMEEKANSRGHSSTQQAAQLALDAGVGRLIMTHVSSRYDEKGCQHGIGHLPVVLLQESHVRCRLTLPPVRPASR